MEIASASRASVLRTGNGAQFGGEKSRGQACAKGFFSADARANSVQVGVQERSTAQPRARYNLVRWHTSRQRTRHSGED
jgi:hypothetical protein